MNHQTNGPLPPEEFQRQLSDFIRQHFQNAKAPSPQTDSVEEPPTDGRAAGSEAFEFHHKPRDVKEYLDRFVIKQDEAKKVLSVALCQAEHHSPRPHRRRQNLSHPQRRRIDRRAVRQSRRDQIL